MDWDSYFMGLSFLVAEKSNCLSIKVGSVIVRDNAVLSTGYNGPPRGVTHCNKRHLEDESLMSAFMSRCFKVLPEEVYQCPRKLIGFASGQGLNYCPSVHSEKNAIVQAAREGINIKNSTIYTTRMPCKDCTAAIINAGIIEIVALRFELYDSLTKFLLESSKIKLRILKHDGSESN